MTMSKGVRPLAGAAVLAAFIGCGARAANAPVPHDEALAALADLRAAIREIDGASRLTDSGPDAYKAAAQRALNALVGDGDGAFDASADNPGDSAGAIGHLDSLASAGSSPAWAPGVQTALVNAMLAQNRLQDALDTKGLDEFQLANARALEALLVAVGRVSDASGFGGLNGALATTELGVPPEASVLDGCAVPSGPGWGTVGGYLVYVAVTAGGDKALPETLGVDSISVRDGIAVVRTPAARMVEHLCATARQDADPAAAGAGNSSGTATASGAGADPEKPVSGKPAASEVSAASDAGAETAGSSDANATPSGANASGGAAALYTEAQAEAGKQVYAEACAVCHGDDLQGKSAPAVAGSAFLNKAKILEWSVANLRHVVVTTMPRSNPGSLSPKQYADVLAYLLAVDCYPAGGQPFPTEATPGIQQTLLLPVSASPDNPETGTCSIGGG